MATQQFMQTHTHQKAQKVISQRPRHSSQFRGRNTRNGCIDCARVPCLCRHLCCICMRIMHSLPAPNAPPTAHHSTDTATNARKYLVSVTASHSGEHECARELSMPTPPHPCDRFNVELCAHSYSPAYEHTNIVPRTIRISE